MEPSVTTTQQTPVRNIKEILVRIASILGVVVLLVIVGALAYQGVKRVSGVNSIASANLLDIIREKESIALSTLETDILLDKPFTLVWEHKNKRVDGSYSLVYDCKQGVYLARKTNTGKDTIFCNTPINIRSTENKLELIPVDDGIDGPTTLGIYMQFTENGKTEPERLGSLQLTLIPGNGDGVVAGANTDTTPTTGGPGPVPGNGGGSITIPTDTVFIPSTGTSDPNGTPDLQVRVLAIGLVDKSTGVFEERTEIPRSLPKNQRGAIKFEVLNGGTKVTESWKFEAELPTNPSFTYKSPSQSSIYPGDRVEFVIGFDSIKNSDSVRYTITIDPNNDIAESNENNNEISRSIPIDR